MDALLNLLVARQIGPGYARIQQQLHPAIAEQWRPVERATAMLPEATQDTMPNINVRDRHLPYNWAMPITNANIDRRDARPSINVFDEPGTTYRRAQRDPDALKELAAVLVHEKHHIDHEPGEGPAYNAQIAMLRQLGASPAAIQSAIDSKAAVK